MYIIEQLEKLNNSENNDSKKILANYFLYHFKSDLTLQKCIKNTGVSRSVIYSFFKETGFNSFNEFIKTLEDEFAIENFNLKNNKNTLKNIIDLDTKQLNLLINKFNKAKKIAFYGKDSEIFLLKNTIKYLRSKDKEILFLNLWNIKTMNDYIESLEDNDVFIIIDTDIRLRYYYDLSLLNPNILDLDIIRPKNFTKFYIGKNNKDDEGFQLGFYIIKNMDTKYDRKEISLLAIDDYICSILKKG